jgi:hypothetical protein
MFTKVSIGFIFNLRAFQPQLVNNIYVCTFPMFPVGSVALILVS